MLNSVCVEWIEAPIRERRALWASHGDLPTRCDSMVMIVGGTVSYLTLKRIGTVTTPFIPEGGSGTGEARLTKPIASSSSAP